MSLNIPDWYVSTFSTNVMLKLQIMGSMLRSTVTEGFHQGKLASPVDQIASVEMLDVTGRFQPMPRVDAALDRRWVSPSDFDLPQMIDSFDKLRLITDPESIYTRNAVLAAGRKIDDVIIAAFLATAKTGETGATSTSFTAGNEVDVAVGGANSRLNVAKLLAVKELMRANFVDFDQEEVYCALTAKDESALLNEIQITSEQFNRQDKPVLSDGKITRFLGINFVYAERLEAKAAGTNEVNVPVWVKSGMHLGIWGDVSTSISRRNDIRSEPWQSYVTGTFGATRLEENKIYNIESYRT
jgi:hypothetical protein